MVLLQERCAWSDRWVGDPIKLTEAEPRKQLQLGSTEGATCSHQGTGQEGASNNDNNVIFMSNILQEFAL